METLCSLFGVFMEKTCMVNLITRMIKMEIIRRLCQDSVGSDAFCGDFMVKIVWRLSGDSMEKRW